jgi:hypothetical protein
LRCATRCAIVETIFTGGKLIEINTDYLLNVQKLRPGEFVRRMRSREPNPPALVSVQFGPG